jgi:hypothetical protein
MLKEFFEGIWIDPKAVTHVYGHEKDSRQAFEICCGGRLTYFKKESGKTYQDFIAWLEECEEEERRLSLKAFERLMDRDPILTAKVEDWLKGVEE